MKRFDRARAILAWSGTALAVGLPLAAAQLAAQVAEADARAPLQVGERLDYDVKFGALRVGNGSMEVRAVVDVRGRAAWHTVFSVRGGIPLYRVDDRMESWIDTSTFASLRTFKQSSEGKRRRTREIELYPERGVYVDAKQPDVERPSVGQPLDEGSFLFFLRTIRLVVGERYDFDRYFKPDRNPVTLEVVRRERITVPAGTFETIVVRPTIKTNGIFSQDGRAEVWLTDDDRHLVVQVKAKVAFGSLSMYLRRYEPGGVATVASR